MTMAEDDGPPLKPLRSARVFSAAQFWAIEGSSICFQRILVVDVPSPLPGLWYMEMSTGFLSEKSTMSLSALSARSKDYIKSFEMMEFCRRGTAAGKALKDTKHLLQSDANPSHYSVQPVEK